MEPTLPFAAGHNRGIVMLKVGLMLSVFFTPVTLMAAGECGEPMATLIAASPIGATLVIVVFLFLRYMSARDKQVTEALKDLTMAINTLRK